MSTSRYILETKRFRVPLELLNETRESFPASRTQASSTSRCAHRPRLLTYASREDASRAKETGPMQVLPWRFALQKAMPNAPWESLRSQARARCVLRLHQGDRARGLEESDAEARFPAPLIGRRLCEALGVFEREREVFVAFARRVGYLCSGLCLSPSHEFRFMLVNQLQQDMASANFLEVRWFASRIESRFPRILRA